MTDHKLPAWAHKCLVGILSTVAVAAGGTIIASARANAVQDQRLDQLEDTTAAMAELSEKLDTTNQNVAVLNAKLEERTK